MPPLPSRIGKYDIVRRLGRGGMGTVYLADDHGAARQVAIKVLTQPTGESDLVKRFLQEARAAANLRHENLVTVYEVGEEADGQLFIAMEFIDGPSLSTIITTREDIGFAQKLSYLDQLCAGLQEVHRAGIVHRDIKPANLLIDSRGILRIVDFGVARVDDSSLTRDGSSIGTIGYMSPEQLEGQHASTKSDIFSVGVVAYELLTCERAFPTVQRSELKPLHHFAPGVPDAMQQWIDRATASDVSERFASVEEVRNALRQVPRVLDATLVRPVHDRRAADDETPWQRTIVRANGDSATDVRRDASGSVHSALTDARADARALTDERRWWQHTGAIAVVTIGVAMVIAAVLALSWSAPDGAEESAQAGAANVTRREAPVQLVAEPSATPADVTAPVVDPAPTRNQPLGTLLPGRLSEPDRPGPRAATPAESRDDSDALRSPAEIFFQPAHDLRKPDLGNDRAGPDPGTGRGDGSASPGLRYEVLNRTADGGELFVDPGTEFRSGDAVRFAFESNIDGFLYVLLKGSSGNWSVLFPHPQINDGRNRVESHRRYVIPSDRWFEFDSTPGRESIVAFLSRSPLGAVPELNRPVRENHVVEQLAVNNLNADIGVRDLRLQKADHRSGDTTPIGMYVVNVAESASTVTVNFDLIHK